MNTVLIKIKEVLGSKSRGMEMVEIAILIAIAVTLGLIFKSQLTAFVNRIFTNLMDTEF